LTKTEKIKITSLAMLSSIGEKEWEDPFFRFLDSLILLFSVIATEIFNFRKMGILHCSYTRYVN
jgi:hypothetical protein